MFNPLRDDPEIKIQIWEHQQAIKAGMTDEEWRERRSELLKENPPEI